MEIAETPYSTLQSETRPQDTASKMTVCLNHHISDTMSTKTDNYQFYKRFIAVLDNIATQ